MDWVNIGKYWKKYRWPCLILFVGILLLLIPNGSSKKPEQEGIIEKGDNILSVEETLSEILSMVQGAGKVRVMLTVSSGEETLYQNNCSISENGNEKQDTVIMTDSERNEKGLVRKIIPPEYLGAIIVCQGADDPTVRLNLIEAVSNVTGLRSDKISILKMN